jgi:hypothetical protein
METFKGYDLGSLVGMFKKSTFPNVEATEYKYDVYEDSGYKFELNGIEKDGKIYDAEITLTPNDKSTVLELDKATEKNNAVYWANEKDYTGDGINDINQAIYTNGFLLPVKDEAGNLIKEAGYKIFYEKFIKEPYDEAGEPLKKKDGSYEDVMCDNGTASGKTINSAEDLLSEDVQTYVNFEDHIKVNYRVLYIDVEKGTKSYTVNARMVYYYSIDGFPFYTATYPEPKSDAYLEGETESSSAGEDSSSITEEASLGDYHCISYPSKITSETGCLEYEVTNITKTIYESEKAPNRLFIYYYPYYDMEGGHDKIEINNAAGLDSLDCYVVKQRNLSISEATTILRDKGYIPSVKCINGGKINLYHNFNTNIGNNTSTTTAWDSAVGFNTVANLSDVLDATNEVSKTSGFSDDEVLSYNIKLVIKDSNGNVVSSLESSKNERIINETETETESGSGG